MPGIEPEPGMVILQYAAVGVGGKKFKQGFDFRRS
jgi:hypothetical protein